MFVDGANRRVVSSPYPRGLGGLGVDGDGVWEGVGFASAAVDQ